MPRVLVVLALVLASAVSAMADTRVKFRQRMKFASYHGGRGFISSQPIVPRHVNIMMHPAGDGYWKEKYHQARRDLIWWRFWSPFLMGGSVFVGAMAMILAYAWWESRRSDSEPESIDPSTKFAGVGIDPYF